MEGSHRQVGGSFKLASGRCVVKIALKIDSAATLVICQQEQTKYVEQMCKSKAIMLKCD